ncbi:MAG: hypothetical protein OXH57_02935 [Ekhidna sp.]|nr:hypothetical protein [Ekhidna sp.]
MEEDAGRKASSALLQIIEFKMSDFKSYIDQRFTSVQWMIGIAFTVLGILMVILKLF